MNYAGIKRDKTGDKLAIVFSTGQGLAWEYPASAEGLAAAKLALKNDKMTSAEDFDLIDGIGMPGPGEIVRCKASGGGDA